MDWRLLLFSFMMHGMSNDSMMYGSNTNYGLLNNGLAKLVKSIVGISLVPSMDCQSIASECQ